MKIQPMTSAYKSCPICGGEAYYCGIGDIVKMPNDYCPTCKKNCCDINFDYEKEGSIIIDEEWRCDCKKCWNEFDGYDLILSEDNNYCAVCYHAYVEIGGCITVEEEE
jgi:hypothetical protein